MKIFYVKNTILLHTAFEQHCKNYFGLKQSLKTKHSKMSNYGVYTHMGCLLMKMYVWMVQMHVAVVLYEEWKDFMIYTLYVTQISMYDAL